MRSQISYGFLIVLAACNGTRTGNPIGDQPGMKPDAGGMGKPGKPDVGRAGDCVSAQSTLDSLTRESPLGFSAADVLAAFAEGQHETTIRWQSDAFITVEPEAGEHDLSVHIEAGSAAPKFVTYTEAEPSGDTDVGRALNGTCARRNAIELQVDLAIESDGGALDEHVTGTLRATSLTWAELDLSIDAGDVGGSLRIDSSRYGDNYQALSLHLDVSPVGLLGRAWVVYANAPADAGALGRPDLVDVADIGAATCSDGGFAVALDRMFQGFDAQNVIDRVNAAQQVTATWHDGSETTASFAFMHDGQPACAVVEPRAQTSPQDLGVLRLYGTLNVHTDDDRIDAHWPVVVEAGPNSDGALGDVNIVFDGFMTPEGPIDDLENQYGISDIDVSAFDDVDITLEVQLPAGSASDLTATLQITGLTDATCPPPPEGPSTCPPDLTPLESATLTAE